QAATWEACLDPQRIEGFLRWHAARVRRSPVSPYGALILRQVAALAKVMEHPNAPALAVLRNALMTPAPLRIKEDHWVSLAQLEAVAEACLEEGRRPLIDHHRSQQHPGAKRASQFQRGVMLKLLVRIPLRQRNVRELQPSQHLRQDQAGHWHL